MRNKGNGKLRYTKKRLSMENEKPNFQLQKLRERLSDRKLTVVAERIGMTYAALSRIMRGGTPSKRTFKRLEEYLNADHK